MVFKAIILGIVQGLTEFIPVSSSGHLIGVRYLFGWNEPFFDKTFDVALHLGTLVALLAYYGRDWANIIGGFFAHTFKRVAYGKTSVTNASGKLLVPIAVACIPAGIVGWKWDSFFEEHISQRYTIATGLVVFGLIMLLAEHVGKKRRDLEKMNYVDYIVIGCAQALALFPGVSRSGITITAGLFRNLDRTTAARFSFLLSMPIILGAGLKKMHDLSKAGGLMPGEKLPLAAGFLAAAVVGYFTIRFLMNYLRTRTLTAFVIWRFVFAGLLAAAFLLKR